jgi:hypothetical protein
MRFLAEITVPACKGNTSIEDGTMAGKIQQIMNNLEPEAAYFGIKYGQRTMFFIFDIPSVDKLPLSFEPFWADLEANVSITPVMTKSELEKGLNVYMKSK